MLMNYTNLLILSVQKQAMHLNFMISTNKRLQEEYKNQKRNLDQKGDKLDWTQKSKMKNFEKQLSWNELEPNKNHKIEFINP